MISDTDADGAHALGRMRERLADRDVGLHLTTVRGPVRDMLDRADAWQPFAAAGAVHRDVPAALAALDLDAASPLRPARAEKPADLHAVL